MGCGGESVGLHLSCCWASAELSDDQQFSVEASGSVAGAIHADRDVVWAVGDDGLWVLGDRRAEEPGECELSAEQESEGAGEGIREAEARDGEVGGATGYALFDGILHKLADATADIPDSQEVTGTTITSSNVIDELGKVVDAIPAALYGSEDLHIYIPQNVHKAYVRTLGGFAVQAFGTAGSESAAAAVGANGIGGNGTTWYNGQGLTFDGIKMFVANGLPNNKMVAAERSNLFFGTGLQSDLNEVKVIDMADIDGSQNVRMVMRATAGVEVGVVEDVVIYS